MHHTDDVAQRAIYQPDPDRITVRETDEDDGLFSVRMPLSSTAEARDGEAFTEDRLRGWAEQINDDQVGVFLDHGRNPDVAGSRYSATGKVGTWQNASLEERDGATDLMADAVMMDPESLSEETGQLRESLARLKSQVERGIPIASSAGWRDDTGDRDVPGGSDLLEGSIVGIPSDPRTTSHDAAVEMARAATAANPDADPEELVAQFRAVVMGPAEQRHLSETQADLALETLDRFVDEQGDASVENFETWLRTHFRTLDEDVAHATRTSLQEFHRETTPLDDPVSEQYRGFLTSTGDGDGSTDADAGDDEGTNDHDMTDDDTTDSGGDDASPDGTHDDGSDDIGAEEFRSQMLEMQRNQTETLSTLADALRENDDGEGDGDDDEDEDDEDGDGDDGGENSADADVDADGGDAGDRTVTLDGEERTVDDAIAALREQADEATPDGSKTNDYGKGGAESGDDESAESSETSTAGGFGFAGSRE